MSNDATLAAKALPNGSAPNAAVADVLPRLVGHYCLLRLLVRGGMGEVYLATTIGIEGAERPVVVKRIRREYRNDPSFHARFLDEARVQAQLDDPGVARIVEASVDEHGDPYVVVEYVEGRSLADVRSRLSRLGKPLPWADAVAVCLEIASALAHVHERTGPDGAPLGIVHRDLSPQNVMVGFAGDVKLIDFGTARGDNRRCHTVSGTVLAKPGYVAPEVARGDSATPRADLYALGVMLWELVAGRRFLEGDPSEHVAAVTAGKLRPAKLAGDPVLAQAGDGAIPAELDRIVAWLTEPVASARCGRAREAAQALAALLATAPRKPVEERGVRARVKAMLARLYPTEPAASRVEFARLVSKARRVLASELAELASASATGRREDAEDDAHGRLTQVPDGLPGTRYRLIRRLGEGAMGVVYEAEHVDLGRKVAIKLLQAKHSASPEFVARFRREARAIAGLVHPNLVHVYDFGQTAKDFGGEWAGRLFFVMERLEGETLDDYLERERGVDWRDACELAIKTCRALEAAHAAGLVHRDLKPANLFLTYSGRRPSSFAEVGLKLLDFGVAKEMRGEGVPTSASEARGEDDPNLSKAGAIFGTPETMSPEQVGGGEVDHRADLYALGCVLYQLLTGRTPFDAPSPILMMSCHLRETPRPPREVAPHRGIPQAVEAIVMRALAKDPADRFADASEMREALEEACYGGFFVEEAQATPAPERTPERGLRYEDVAFDVPVETTTRVERPRRRRGGFVMGALVACALAAFAVASPSALSRLGLPALPTTLPALPAPIARALHLEPKGESPATATAQDAEAIRGTATPTGADHADEAVVALGSGAVASATIPTSAPGATAQASHAPAQKPSVAAKTEELASPKLPDLATAALPETASSSPTEPGETKVASASEAAPEAPEAEPAKPTPAQVDAKIAQGEVDEALALARAAKDDGTAESAAAWARAAFAAGRYDEAHQAAVAWIARHADASALPPRLLDARALRAAGRYDEARARLDEALEKHPGSAEVKSMIKDLDLLRPAKKASSVKHKAGKKRGPQKLLG